MRVILAKSFSRILTPLRPLLAADVSVSVACGKIEMLFDPAKARLELADQDAVANNDRMIFDHRAPEAHNLIAELLAGRIDLGVYGQDVECDSGGQRADFRLKLGAGFRGICANVAQRPHD